MHFIFFWKPTKGHNSKSYGLLAPFLIYTIHPVIVHVYMDFQLSICHSSVTKIFKIGKIWKPIKGHNSKSYGPLATILPLHLPYLREQVWYTFHWRRTTNIKVIIRVFYTAHILVQIYSENKCCPLHSGGDGGWGVGGGECMLCNWKNLV